MFHYSLSTSPQHVPGSFLHCCNVCPSFKIYIQCNIPTLITLAFIYVKYFLFESDGVSVWFSTSILQIRPDPFVLFFWKTCTCCGWFSLWSEPVAFAFFGVWGCCSGVLREVSQFSWEMSLVLNTGTTPEQRREWMQKSHSLDIPPSSKLWIVERTRSNISDQALYFVIYASVYFYIVFSVYCWAAAPEIKPRIARCLNHGSSWGNQKRQRQRKLLNWAPNFVHNVIMLVR